MSATWEGGGHYDLQAWTDMLWLRSAVAQSREFNNAARTRLEAVKDETVLALSDADKTLQAPLTSDRIRRRDPRVTPFPKIAQPSLSKPDNRLSGRPQPPNGVRWPYGMLLRNTRSCVVQAGFGITYPFRDRSMRHSLANRSSEHLPLRKVILGLPRKDLGVNCGEILQHSGLESTKRRNEVSSARKGRFRWRLISGTLRLLVAQNTRCT